MSNYERTKMNEVRCEICGKTEPSSEVACGKGWTPYFYIREVEHDCVCLECTRFLQTDPDGSGEMILKPGLDLDALRQQFQNEGEHISEHDAQNVGCEFCIPALGDPFTNRPRNETWTCPYCNTVYSGKETS